MATNANVLNTVVNQLLTSADLGQQDLSRVVHALHQPASIDYADIYLQAKSDESWGLEDGVVKHANYGSDLGFGLRAISGAQTAFAYADSLSSVALEQAAKSLQSDLRVSIDSRSIAVPSKPYPQYYSGNNPLDSMQSQEKVDCLQCLDQYARAKDPRVKRVQLSFASSYSQILMLNSRDIFTADQRPMTMFRVVILVESGGRIESASASRGGRYDYRKLPVDQLQETVDKAVRKALVNLEAISAPAGEWPVILGPGWPAVLLHEAVGHGLEADACRRGGSAFSGRIGERVASELCTVIDDGTVQDSRGSLSLDDEGNVTKRTVLIEKGILKGYMQDEMNARLMGQKVTGNGRRESFAHAPMPRMTNTYMLGGQSDPDEMLASVKRGIYAVDFSGGQVDTTSGDFVFTANEAYLIEDGKVQAPLKNATLIGNGPEALREISMLGNDCQMDLGGGVCGKDGQSVPVSVGQPTVKVDRMVIGGVSC